MVRIVKVIGRIEIKIKRVIIKETTRNNTIRRVKMKRRIKKIRRIEMSIRTE